MVDQMVSHRTRSHARLRQALWIGAGLQAVCLALVLLDLWVFGTVQEHVEEAYPAWRPDQVHADRNAIIIYLAVVGVLGIAGWLASLWAVARDRSVRAVVTTLFAVGTGIALIDASVGGEAYDQIVPLWLGTTHLVLPLLPGIAALLAVWSPRRES